MVSLYTIGDVFRLMQNDSIGLPPAGKFHMDLDPTRLIFRNQSVKGTMVSGLADVDETLEFARRGK